VSFVDTSYFQLAEHIVGDDEEDTQLLHAMYHEPLVYLRSHRWAPAVEQAWLAYGIGKIVALFLVEFVEPVGGAESCLWIVVGDLPSAYFVVERARNAANALEVYYELMDDWIGAVRCGEGLPDVFPVEAAPTAENADQLEWRLAFIREEIIPALSPD
jgi:hypothetical protein